MRLARVLPLALLTLPALACTDSNPSNGEGADEVEGESTDTTDTETSGEPLRPNWHQDIAPLVTENCMGCHEEGGIAPFALSSYTQAALWSTLMADSAEARSMPPWHAVETDECQPPFPFLHDARLSDDEIALLREWADLGAPEGDPADAAPLPDPQNLELANPTTVVTMDASLEIDVEGQTRDFFHCVSFDPGNDQDVYVDGLQVVPGNRSIVHHVVVYLDESATSAGWTDGVKQDCGGGAGIPNATMIAAWVPGGLPTETPAGVGIELPAGSRLIYNVHYHATGTGPELDDATGVALRWTTDAPEWVSRFALIGAPGSGTAQTGEFVIPAGATDHVEEYEWEVAGVPDAAEARVWLIAGHMHKVAVDLKASFVSGADDTCLLQTPAWDFNWQRSYVYDTPIEAAPRVVTGDRVRVRCTYDNTLDNPALLEALAEVGADAPIDVELGEETLDEMCIAAVGVAVRSN